jgi:hypothetical protein
MRLCIKNGLPLFDGFGYNFALLCFAYGIFLVVFKQLKDRDFKEDAIAKADADGSNVEA